MKNIEVGQILLIVAILFEAANSGATKTKIMYDVYSLSLSLARS